MAATVEQRGIVTVLGGEHFVSKKAAGERVSQILESAVSGEALSGVDRDVMFSVLLRHPRIVEKLQECIDIVVDRETTYGGRCFWIVGRDERVDFSYRQCLSPVTAFGKFVAACRNEIEDDVQDFKRVAFFDGIRCPVNGRVLSWDDCDVDHAPPRIFSVLVRGFIEDHAIDVASVRLLDRGIGSVIADSHLAHAWREYHNSRADLRLLSAEANRHPSAA